MRFHDKYTSVAFIRLKRLNLPAENIMEMVNETTSKMNSNYETNFTASTHYDSDDEILDPKTEIQLVTIKSDETEGQIEEPYYPLNSEKNLTKQQSQKQSKSNVESITSHSFSSTNLQGNMLERMRSQFQNGTNQGSSSKHRCLMSGTGEITIASEYCTAERPCMMSLDKMSLHYVIHYIKRGVWDIVVPEVADGEQAKIDGYQCNICEKKFRNNHSKEEYPARGSFLCHFATEHGKIIDAMRNDDVVNMKPVIDILENREDRLSKFVKNGTETAHDRDSVKVLESITWKIQQNKTNNSNKTTNNQRKSAKTVIKCPKCNEFDKNKDPNNLKLHIFHHYLEFWEGKVPHITNKETVCEQCTPPKRIIGANPEGCRIAIICHRAMHHGELRTVLENDKELPTGFIEELFGEVAVRPVKVMHAGKNKDQPDDGTKCEEEVREERERIALEVRKREIMKIFQKKKNEEKVYKCKDGNGLKRKRIDDERLKITDEQESLKDSEDGQTQRLQMLKNFRIQKNIVSAENNEPYVGKRIKQNLKNISFDDDSDEDIEWTKKSDKCSPVANIETLTRKILPKRQVAPTKIVVSDESDDDWDNM